MTSQLQVSKPYPHGTQFRCRVKSPAGWRWCTSADSPEGAALAALNSTGVVDTHQEGSQEFGIRPDPSPQENQISRGPQPGAGLLSRDKLGPSRVRITGPYEHRPGEWRCWIITSAGREWAPIAGSERAAQRLAERMADAAARQGSITIEDSIDAFVESKRQNGSRSATLEGTRRGLVLYWSGMLDSPISRITPQRAQAQYDQLRQLTDTRPGRGKPLSVDTTRSYLKQAKMWARWAVKRGWFRVNPLEAILGLGRRKRGKKQLSWDEGNRLGAVCLAEASEGGAAVLMAMLMGLRASEVLSRVVRDIDRGGESLRVDDNDEVAFKLKNDSSRRPVLIPTLLRPLLAQLAQGKEPADPLFPGTLCGRRRRQWLHVEVRRLCRKANVQIICAHSLRGWMTTSAVAAGELPEVVAREIGHASAKMTMAHYIAPGVAEAAQLARGQAAFAASQTTSLPA